jgi:hypothetical protein
MNNEKEQVGPGEARVTAIAPCTQRLSALTL